MKNLNQLIAVLMIELIIFIPLSVVAQNNANETPTEADKTPPFINVTIPSYVTTNRIDITGTTEPMSTVYLYVNGVKQRKSTPNPQGRFNFPSVDLSSLVPANTLKFEAIDPANNINIKEFTVAVDLTPPELTIDTKFPELTDTSTLLIQGTISEAVKLDITLNDDSVLSEENISAFNKTINLVEGNNLLEIIAADPANNTDKVTAEMYLDTQPPVIANLTPETGAFFYETYAQTDIEGDTEPYTKIEIFIETREQDPFTGNVTTKRGKIASTTSDATGHFRLEDVDLFGTTVIPGFLVVRGGAGAPIQLPPGAEGALPEIERPQEVTPLNLVLVATDRMGHATELRLNYRIGTCYGGGMDWNIINLIEYQAPTSISPERLEEGTEIISFILNLSYQGAGQDPIIRDVRFERACTGEIVKDNMYKYSCAILPTSLIRKPNDAKTLWYIRYNLKKLEGMDEFTDDVWKDLTRQFKFPLKVKIEYTHKILNPNTGKYEDVRAYQTKCMDVAYHVDTSRIDPREVLPDWLLDDGAEAINRTIQNLNKLIENIDKVVEYIAIACGSMFAVRIIMTIYRRWVSHSEYITDKLLSKAGTLPLGKPSCPKPGTAEFKKIFEEELAEEAKRLEAKEKISESERVPTTPLKLLGKPNTDQIKKEFKKQLDELKQDDLPNNFTEKGSLSEIYNLFIKCPRTYNAWQREAKVYQTYRWACDRFLCRSSPARWTETQDFTVIRQKIEKAAACTQETSSQGVILRKYPAEKCTFKNVADKTRCWVYKEGVYTPDRTEEGEVVLKLVGGTGVLGVPEKAPAEITVTESSGNVFFENKQENCEKLCQQKKFKEGKCLNPIQFGIELRKKGTTDRVFEAIQQKANCPKANPTCYCFDRLDKIKDPPIKEWDYRYHKLKYYYDPYKYYKGRDLPACFGQNSWISREAPYLNVQNTLPAFQCLCIPQIRNRLVLFKNILSGLHNCLQQIKITGRADAGVCKEMFTQYICKWLYRVIAYFIQGCTPWTGAGKDPEAVIGERIRGGMGAIFGGVQEATNDLFEDYDNAALRDYLGVGEGAIAEKICLGALTGDWGFDLEGFIDSAYSQPYHSSASAWPADREYLTWDPDNEQATYEYRAAWMITPGCDIDRYTISLSCVTDYELYNFDGVECEQARNPNADEDDNSPSGCDCTSDAIPEGSPRVNQAAPGPTRVIYTGGALKQGSFESRSVHSVQTGFQRYDNVKITLYINNPEVAEQCIPSGHLIGKRMGVFYSPISDATTYDIVACRFDPTQGYFRCDQGRLLWNLRGRAYFGSVKCDNVPCDEKVYYVDDSIKLNPFEVYVQGQKQCLYMQLFNNKGERLLEREGRFIDLEPAEDDPTRTILLQRLNELDVFGAGRTITKADFGKVPATWTVDPSGSYAKLIQEGTITEREVVSIYFRDTSEKPDQKADQYRLQGTAWQTWGKNVPVPIGKQGMLFEFVQPPQVPEISECIIDTEKFKPCREYKFTIKPPTFIPTDKAQDWTLVLELRHAPGNRSQGSCSESRRQDIISYQGQPQKKEFKKIKVKPWTLAEDIECKPGGLYKNLRACDCDGDRKPGGDNDCDGSSKFYCKDKICNPYLACKAPNTENFENCDCDWDGKEGDKESKNCMGMYCWDDGKCHPDPKELARPLTAEAAKKLEEARKKAPDDAKWIGIDPEGNIAYYNILSNKLYAATPEYLEWSVAYYADGKLAKFLLEDDKLIIWSEQDKKWFELSKIK